MSIRPIESPKNVLGGPLQLCGTNPITGYYRDGFCRRDDGDLGMHVVASIMTEEFLEFSKYVGNDLSTPRPESGFPGLKPGDRWCLCASRWLQSEDAGVAPPVVLEATHVSALEMVPLETLQRHALQ